MGQKLDFSSSELHPEEAGHPNTTPTSLSAAQNRARTSFCCLVLCFFPITSDPPLSLTLFYEHTPVLLKERLKEKERGTLSEGGQGSHVTAAVNNRTFILLTGIVFSLWFGGTHPRATGTRVVYR